MSRKFRSISATLVLAVGAVVVGASGASADQQTVFSVTMSGDQVVETQGDPDATGTATITVNHKLEQVCVDIDTTNLATPTEDYTIRTGAAGEPPEAVVVIINVNPNDPDPSTCNVDSVGFSSFKELWKIIEDSPEDFNLSVINFEHGEGAIRGQLNLVSK